jgi:hypothetical protein
MIKCVFPAVLTLALYPVFYFTVLALPPTVRLSSKLSRARTLPVFANSRLIFPDGKCCPDYHGIPGSIFAPMYELDQNWLRPGHWHEDAENQSLDGLLFDAN